MKYILRDNQTGRYLQRAGCWAQGKDEAMTFDDLLDAREYCQAYLIENVDPIPHWPSLFAFLRRPQSRRVQPC